MAELEARSFDDVLKIAKMLDFLDFNDTENLGLENKIAQILYRKYQALTVAEKSAINVGAMRGFYGINGKCGVDFLPYGNSIQSIWSFSFSPNESLIGIRDENSNFQLYSVADQQLVGPVGNVIQDVKEFQFNPKRAEIGLLRYFSSDIEILEIYSVPDFKLYRSFIANNFCFSPDGTLLSVVNRRNNHSIYSISNLKEIAGGKILEIYTSLFSPDGLLLALHELTFSKIQLYRKTTFLEFLQSERLERERLEREWNSIMRIQRFWGLS